jgi:hypothetical protein
MQEKMRIPDRSSLKAKRKTILATLVITITAFTVGAYANRVIIQQVQSIGGNQTTVPAPELKILNTFWNLELNSSLVTGLILNLTTTGAPGATGTKLYQVAVEVSCLTSTGTVQPNCAIGTTLVTLPVNLNGTSVMIPVQIAPAVDPEITEIDNLSFIVTAVPDPSIMSVCLQAIRSSFTPCYTPVAPNPCITLAAPPAKPDFALFAQIPGMLILTLTSNVTVPKIVQSFCDNRPVRLTATASPDLSITISAPNPAPLPLNGIATFTETISATPTAKIGPYTVTDTAFDGLNMHTFSFMVWFF